MALSSFTVALVGPDGAGKSTICRLLLEQLPWPTTYLYMGVNQDACNVLLPTTRLWLSGKKLLGIHSPMGGPPPSPIAKPDRRSRPWRTVKSLLRTGNLLAEEWYRQWICDRALRAGQIVIMDRHFLLDYHAHDVRPKHSHRTLASRIHGRLLQRFPAPDLIVLLDAPAAALFQRKPEGTVEALERRRQEYLALRDAFPHFVIIDAMLPVQSVLQQVVDAIATFRASRSQLAQSETNALLDIHSNCSAAASTEKSEQLPNPFNGEPGWLDPKFEAITSEVACQEVVLVKDKAVARPLAPHENGRDQFCPETASKSAIFVGGEG